MAVPKRKTSKSRRNMRRAHDFLTVEKSVGCPSCGNRKLPHHVCPTCGTYKGHQVADMTATQA